jgi:hypothetical protein
MIRLPTRPLTLLTIPLLLGGNFGQNWLSCTTLNIPDPIQKGHIQKLSSGKIHRHEGELYTFLALAVAILMTNRFGPPGIIHYSFSLAEWAKRPEVVKAWKELAEKHDLMEKEFRDVDRVFSFTDAALSWSQSIYFR